MQKKITGLDAITLLLWALPPLYLVTTYSSLPAQMPLHFDIHGNPDRIGTKQTFLLVVLGISIVGLGVALLIRFVPRIDPKKKAQYSPTVFAHFSQAILLLMAFLTGLVVYSGTKTHFVLRANMIFPVIALFLALIGSMLGKVKPNYFVGIRTPWTLENEEVWRKTHQLAARIWLPGGLLLAALGWVVDKPFSHYIFLGCILIMALVPVIYSYRYYQRIKKEP